MKKKKMTKTTRLKYNCLQHGLWMLMSRHQYGLQFRSHPPGSRLHRLCQNQFVRTGNDNDHYLFVYDKAQEF